MRTDLGSASRESGRFDPAGEFAMYRFHLHDWISFHRSLELTFVGRPGQAKAENASPLEFRSVAFWYGRRVESDGEATLVRPRRMKPPAVPATDRRAPKRSS